MKRRLLLSLLAVGMWATGPSIAAPAAPPEGLLASRPLVNGPLTLDQAVETALRESPVVRGAAEEVEAAAGRLAAARAERRPWVSVNLFASGGSSPSLVAGPMSVQPQAIMALPKDAFVDGNLMVMFPLFTSGRLSGMVRQASAMRNASRADLEAQRQEVALLTRSAYREVQARRSLVEVWQAKLKEDEERLRVDRIRLREGQIASVYVLRDEAEVAATRQELTKAARDVELTLLQLTTVMGVHPASRVEVAAALEPQSSQDLLTRLAGDGADAGAGLLRLAARRRPELEAAEGRIAAARADTASVRGAYGPQVNLFAMGDAMKAKGMDPFTGATYGLAASFPLYSGGQRKGRVQTAEAGRRRLEQERERSALQVAQEVNGSLVTLRAAEQNVATAQAALAAAREEYRVQLLRYQAGRSVLVEVLDALSARSRAESGVVQAAFQQALAADRLLRAVGEPIVPGAR
jgi:outer membrane protein TolC